MKGPFYSIFLTACFFPLLLSAQTAKEKLEEVHGSERAQELKKEHPQVHAQLIHELKHGYKLIPTREGKSYQELDSLLYFAKKREVKKRISSSKALKKIEEGSFNLLKCHLDRKKSAPSLFELKGTGKVLVLPSEEELSKSYNNKR